MNLSESFNLAFSSLRSNKLRAMLTILGITVGIFSIVVIMTIITMLQTTIESGVSQLGKNTFQIQKFPALMDDMDHMKYHNRPDITLDEFYRLQEKLTQAKYLAAEQWGFGKMVKFKSVETNPNVNVAGITAQAILTNDFTIESGRPLREYDVETNNPVICLGPDVAQKLFPNSDPLGNKVKIDGRELLVIGVFEKKGSLFGQSQDNFVTIPLSVYQSMYGRRSRSIGITVSSYGKEDYNEIMEAAIGYMRTIRKVPAGEESNFAIFSNESILEEINSITKYVEIGAMAVSFIALVAAGVGIMNIMLVSVTERTREIGVRKAVGAKKMNILVQFLIEAIALCLFGGILGIVLGVGLGNLVGTLINATPAIPFNWVFIGLGLCVGVGLIFGTYPAYKASNLDPIEALRYE